MYCSVSRAMGMSRMSTLALRMRYSSRSSGPSKVSKKTSSASGGMYRSRGSSVRSSPRTLATDIGVGIVAWTGRARTVMNRSRVAQTHRLAPLAHSLVREPAGLLAAVGDNVSHKRGIVQVLLRPLAHGRLFGEHRVDHRLLALQAPDPCGPAALLGPCARLVVGVDKVKLPDGTLGRIARIGALHARRVRRHGAYLPGDGLRLLAQPDGVVV